MNVLPQEHGNKTHYQLEINRCNGKSFCQLQDFLWDCLDFLKLCRKAIIFSFLFTRITSDFHINGYFIYLAYICRTNWSVKVYRLSGHALCSLVTYPFKSSIPRPGMVIQYPIKQKSRKITMLFLDMWNKMGRCSVTIKRVTCEFYCYF